jgi:hypothetical protein
MAVFSSGMLDFDLSGFKFKLLAGNPADKAGEKVRILIVH